MVRNIFAAMIIAFCVQTAFAQSTNPKRTVLFKLGDNEVVCNNEYILMQKLNQNKFACILYDTKLEQCTFVFNGKRISILNCGVNTFSASERVFHLGINNFPYINLEEENGYVFYFDKDERYYVNYKGIIHGPFDEVTFYADYTEEGYDYYYKREGIWYGRKDEKIKKVNFAYQDFDKEKNKWYWYVNKNGYVEKYDNFKDIPNKGNFEKGGNYEREQVFYDMIWHQLHVNPASNDIGIISPSGKEHSFSCSLEYNQVVINGKRFGISLALNAWYDKDKNAFIWNAIEGQELVVYEYKLD